jgi:putative endonuclease
MKNFISEKQKIGKLGEDVACKYLEKKGYVILERNYTRKWGEIDIVSCETERIHFIEVKLSVGLFIAK